MPTTAWLNSLEDRGEPDAEDLMTDDEFAAWEATTAAMLIAESAWWAAFEANGVDEMPF